MNSDCIFCKIVAGEIPGTKVYEDDEILAFMDIGPIMKGHVLVIPKSHHEQLVDTPDELLAKCIAVAKRVAKAQIAALGAAGVNLHQANGAAAGQVVPHLHFHLIPRFENDGHHWNWNAGEYESMDEMAAFAAGIRNLISGGKSGA